MHRNTASQSNFIEEELPRTNFLRLSETFEMVPRACPVCGEQGKPHVYAEADFDPNVLGSFAFASRKLPEYMHYRLVHCGQCDLLYADPIPTLEMLSKAYQEADFDSNVEANYASQTYGRYLAPILRSLPDLEGALDIGTGDGAFLERLLEAGFTDVEGVEPSEAPIAAAKEHIRSRIRHGLFQAEDYTPASFRLVSCFQTIEHLYEPLAMCRSVIDLLKPGGALFLVCHNRRGVLNRILGKRSPVFDIEHLQLFSPESVKRMLEVSGYENIQVRSIVNRYPISYWVKLLPLPVRFKIKLLARLQKSRIGSVLIPMRVGNLAVIGYKPTSA